MVKQAFHARGIRAPQMTGHASDVADATLDL
jgi:hypothetical protein